MKRLTMVTLLMVTLIALTACAPKVKDINAVVNRFMEHWHDGDAAKMAALMTDEVEFGLILPEETFVDSLSNQPASKVPANEVTESITKNTKITFTITKTEAFGDYAVVSGSYSDSAAPDNAGAMYFHLVKTKGGWRIRLIGFSPTNL